MAYQRLRNKPRRKTKVLLLLIGIIILTGSLLLTLEKTGVTNFYTKERNNVNSDPTTEPINYNPPTTDEQQAGDIQKDLLIEDMETGEASNSETAKTAHVIITDAGQYDNIIEVRSFISDHYQDGTCTITFTKGSYKVSKATPAYRDASTTICTNPLFNRSDFPTSGEWQVMVSYLSADADGESTPQTITIN